MERQTQEETERQRVTKRVCVTTQRQKENLNSGNTHSDKEPEGIELELTWKHHYPIIPKETVQADTGEKQ